MPKPLVSVVLPTYNGSRFLEQAIQSCLDQSYSHFELIVVDDASSDGSPEIIARYEALDTRIRSVRHASNLGLPAALNSGFAMSRGELLTWTSDDNMYHPDALSVLVDSIRANPRVAVVYAGQSFINEQGQVIGHESAGPPEELPYRNCVGPCFLYRRSVYEKVGGYDTDASLVEDYDFWLRAFGSFSFCALPEDLYFYRVHEGSLSQQDSQGIKLATRRILQRNLDGWDKQSRSLAYLRVARDASDMGDPRIAWSSFGKAILGHPRSLLGKISWTTLLALVLTRRHFGKLKRIVKTPLSQSSFRE
jgi:glycosyltransferase involved in cell wall biosynthesis